MLSKRQSRAGRGDGLTRGEVAGLLGTSIASVRRMEGKTLHPTRDRDGVWRFDPDEVKRVPSRWREPEPRRVKKREGRLAAQVFAMFEEGSSLSEIVRELEEPPAVIRGLYAEWCTSLDDGERVRMDATALRAELVQWATLFGTNPAEQNNGGSH